MELFIVQPNKSVLLNGYASGGPIWIFQFNDIVHPYLIPSNWTIYTHAIFI